MPLRGQLRVRDPQGIFQVPNSLRKLCNLLVQLLSGGEDEASDRELGNSIDSMRTAVLPIALTGGQGALERSNMVSRTSQKVNESALTSGHIALQPRLTQELHGTDLSHLSLSLGKTQGESGRENGRLTRDYLRHSAQLKRAAPFLRFFMGADGSKSCLAS